MEKKKKKRRQKEHSMMDNIEYMENFATEFSKHDVLMYPSALLKKKVGDLQEARKYAYKQIGEALSFNDWRMAQHQSMFFRQQCIQKMRRFVRLSLIRGGSGHEALELAPDWLKKLNPAFNLLNRALKLESTNDGPMQATRKRMNNFMWNLFGAVRDVVDRSNQPSKALRGHDAVQCYAEKIGLPFLTLYEIWNRLLQLSLHKMIEVRSSGDRPSSPHRPTQLEWRLINMALLHDLRIIVVHDDSFTNSREVSAMIQLYMLMCEAQIKFGSLMKNQKNKDMPNIACEVKSQNIPSPSCSKAQSEQSDEEESLVWEVADLWKYVHAEYIKRGRTASLILLQRRWHELRQITRRRLLDAFRERDLHPHPLLLAIGKRFPSVVRSPLPAWNQLVANNLIFTDSNLDLQKQKEYSDDFPPDASMKDVTTDLLDWSDDDLEIIESEREVIEIASDSDSEPNTNDDQIDAKLLDKVINQVLEENIAKFVQKSDNKTIIGTQATIKLECESASTPQDEPVKEKNTSISVPDTNLTLNQLDPTRTKVRIIFEDDSDLEELERMNSNNNTSDDDTEMDDRNENSSNTNDKPEITNENEIIDSNIADKTNAINNGETNVVYNTDVINKNVFNKDELSENNYTINETNKNVVNAGTETMDSNGNSDLIQDTCDFPVLRQILCEGMKSSSSPNELQTSDDFKDATIQNEDNLVEFVVSGKDHEKVIKPNRSNDDYPLTERPNSFDSTFIKKIVVANFYKMIGSDILNIPSKKVSQYPKNTNLIKHTKEVFRYAPEIKLMNIASDEKSDRPISELRSLRDAAQVDNDAFIIDSKLLKLSRVVVTPLEDIPEWRALSRNGTIKCRRINMKKFTAAPAITSEMLTFCRRYSRTSPFGRTYPPSLRRRTFTGLSTRSSQQLASLPRGIKAIKKKLTRRLRLSKTYYTAEFWSNLRNQKHLAMCSPVTVKVERLASRVVKKVELTDIDEVRRINRTILTAQVAPNNVISNKTQVVSGERKLSNASSSLANTFVMTSPSTAPTVMPTKEELKIMIKDLVLPSIKALDTYPHEESVAIKQKTNRSALWRIDDKKLENDIRDVVEILSIKEQSKITNSNNKYKKKLEKQNRTSITGSEQPIDAYAEWQRQKTCTQKYFNFTTPGSFEKIKMENKHEDEPKLIKNEINKMTFATNVNANVETINVMSVSDDEDDALVICEESKDDEEDVSLDNDVTLAEMDSLKRPNSDSEPKSYKRRKLSIEISDPSYCKPIESTSNDCDLIVIDDDEPVKDESISSQATQSTSTVKLMVSRDMESNHVRPSQVLYIVNTGNTAESRSTTIVATYTVPSVNPKSAGTQKLPLADSTLLISEIPTSLNSTLQSSQNTISLISTFPGPQKSLLLSSTEPGTQSQTSANTFSGSQTMSVNSTLTNSDEFTSSSSTSSHHPKVTIDHQPRKLVTLKPTLAFEEAPTLLNSSLSSAEKASLNSNLNEISNLPILEKPLALNSKLGSTVHNVGTVKVGSHNPITLNVATSPPSLRSLAQYVSTECIMGRNKKVEPHIVIDATVKSKDSSDEVSRKNVDNSIEIGLEELNFITASTNHTTPNNESHDGLSSGTNAELQTDANPRIVSVISLADEDNSSLATNYNKSELICSESHINEINPNIRCAFTKSEGIVKSPNLFDDNDKLRSENKVDDSDGGKPSLPVISSVSSLAPRIRVKDEFKITNFDLTPQCLSSTVSYDGSLLDTQRPDLKLTNESFEIIEKDLSAEKQKELKRSPVETRMVFDSVSVKYKKILVEDENNTMSKTSVIVKTEQRGKTIKGKRKASDNDDECEETVGNGGGIDTLLVGMETRYVKWTAASEVHTNQRTEDNTSVYFSSAADLGASAAPVGQYAAHVSDPDEPLLKVDSTRPWWLLDNKYVLLTDERVHCQRTAYLSSVPVKNIAPYTVLLFPPPDGRRLTLDLGAKKGRDVVVCGCQPRSELCVLCESLAQHEHVEPERSACTHCGVTATRERTQLLRLKHRAYRKVSDRPLKYVFADMRRACNGCREGVQLVADPEAVLINGKAYEKISSDPLMYSPVLCVVQTAQCCSALVKQEAELYLFNLRTSQRRRLLYHGDDKHKGFNNVVFSLMAKMDREETNSWYRLQREKSSTVE